MLTKKSKYGLKALILLTRDRARGPLSIAELAERERIPKKFLELILLDGPPCEPEGLDRMNDRDAKAPDGRGLGLRKQRLWSVSFGHRLFRPLQADVVPR